MQFILKRLNVLIIFFFINMAITKKTLNFSSTVSSFEISIPMTLRSISIAETEQKLNKSNSAVNETLTETEEFTSAFTENDGLDDDTTSEFDNSTDESNDEVDDIHSHFNLAIIPAAAVLVFVVIICFKCCKWLRQYTRGGNKDEQFYAVIVTDDDKEYGKIDITSESASTVCYSTDNENSLSSIRKWNQDSIKGKSSTSSLSKTAKKVTGYEPSIRLECNSLSSIGTILDQSNGDSEVRIHSTSSAGSVSEQLTDSPSLKRNNKFRVSFNTDVKLSASENKTPNGDIKQEKFMRSSLKKSSSTATSPENSSPSITSERTSRETNMVDVGTQTYKSFRYSIRKSKGHASDSDLDERFFGRISASTLALQSKKNKRQDKGANSLSENSDLSKVETCEERSNGAFQENSKSLLSTDNPESSKYPLDTNVQVVKHCKQTNEFNGNLDLDDDVFIEENKMKSDLGKHTYKTNSQISGPLQNTVSA